MTLGIAIGVMAGFIFGFFLCAVFANHRQTEMCVDCWSNRNSALAVVVKKPRSNCTMDTASPQPTWFRKW